MKHKVLFAGIDGSGKSTCLNLLISRLESRFSIIKISNDDPYLFFRGSKKLAVKYQWYWIMKYLRPISKKYHFHGGFLILNFIFKFIFAKYIEFFKKCDLIIYETDILLHPAVYITFHLPLSRMIKIKTRFKIVEVLFGSRKNLWIFYLDTKPEVAMNRIHKRAEKGVDIHTHENTRDLGKLKKEFDGMVEIASENGFEIFRITTNDKNLEEVAAEVQVMLEKKITTNVINGGKL